MFVVVGVNAVVVVEDHVEHAISVYVSELYKRQSLVFWGHYLLGVLKAISMLRVDDFLNVDFIIKFFGGITLFRQENIWLTVTIKVDI